MDVMFYLVCFSIFLDLRVLSESCSVQWGCRRFLQYVVAAADVVTMLKSKVTLWPSIIGRFPQEGDIDEHEIGRHLFGGVSFRHVGDRWCRCCLNMRVPGQILEPMLDGRVVLVVN